MAAVFLLVGALGLVVLVLSLFAGELGEFGHPDADGPFSVPAIAALLGGVGFGGAAATAVLPEALPDAVTVVAWRRPSASRSRSRWPGASSGCPGRCRTCRPRRRSPVTT